MKRSEDGHGRLRNLTIAFRISPEDNEMLNRYVELSGLTKQDYITKKLLNKDIVVLPNARVYKALKDQMKEMTEKIDALASLSDIKDEDREFIFHIGKMLSGLKTEN